MVIVIVLNWNGKDDTIECLASLQNLTYANYEVVVVDNGSTDGSVSAIRECFPAVTLIENDVNLGFAEGNNVGIRFALERGADYALLLNNDTVVDGRLLAELVSVAESDDRIGVVGPKMYFFDAPQTIWTAGGTIHFGVNIARSRGWNQLDRGQFDSVEQVDYIPGCGLLARAAMIRDVGLLDLHYPFIYYEDTDWCYRASRAGYKMVYAPGARLWHKVSTSMGGGYNPRALYLQGLNSVVFMRKHASALQWAKFLSTTILTLPPLLLVRTLQGHGQAVVAKATGILDGLFRREPARHRFLTG
jgi:GT2 family glycosyltransferase